MGNIKNGILLLAVAITFGLGLGRTSIYIVDESRNAQAAWEMLAGGTVVVPTFNGVLRTDKPPLHYYGMQLGYLVLGKSPLAARLFSVVCGALTLLLLYRFARREWGEPAGVWAVVLGITSLYLPLQFRLATPDPYLIACFTAAALGLWRAYSTRAVWQAVLAFGVLGLAVLAKGPVAPVLLGGGVGVFVLSRYPAVGSHLLRFRPVLGVLLVALVALPWFWQAHVQTDGAFTQGFFWEHNVQRFTDTKEGHGGFPLLVPALVLLCLLPTTVLLPQAWRHWRQHWSDVTTYLLAIVGVTLVFFSLSQTQLPSYPAVVYPLILLLMAPVGARIASGEYAVGHIQYAVWAGIALALPVGLYVALGQWPALAAMQHLAYAALLVPVGVLTAWGLHGVGRRSAALYTVFGAFWSLQLLLFGWFLPRIDAHNHVQRSLPLLTSDAVVVYQRFTPAYRYYREGELPVFTEKEQLQAYLVAHAAACPMVIATHHQADELATLPGLVVVFHEKDLFENLTTIIYRYDSESCP